MDISQFVADILHGQFVAGILHSLFSMGIYCGRCHLPVSIANLWLRWGETCQIGTLLACPLITCLTVCYLSIFCHVSGARDVNLPLDETVIPRSAEWAAVNRRGELRAAITTRRLSRWPPLNLPVKPCPIVVATLLRSRRFIQRTRADSWNIQGDYTWEKATDSPRENAGRKASVFITCVIIIEQYRVGIRRSLTADNLGIGRAALVMPSYFI